MRRLLLSLLCVSAACLAQQNNADRTAQRADLQPALSFEAPPNGDLPGGWNGGPGGTVFADSAIVHSGHGSVRIERNATSPNNFSNIGKTTPIDFSGKTVELRGFLRLQDVSGFAGLWLREDGDAPTLAFNNMHERQLKGTKDWAAYKIELPLVATAQKLVFGVLMNGTGRVWADDLKLLVDGKPIWELPQAKKAETALDRDHQFDGGSRVVIDHLTATQIENLSTLGKVWGFLKYHHPAVTSGQRHWDYDLFRVLPSVIGASDRPSANAALLHWIDELGPVPPCKPCAKVGDKDLVLRPNLDWISDEKSLGTDLSRKLRSIYENRTPETQFYLQIAPEVGNTIFKNESAYDNIKLPDAGFQLLALYRFWNIFQYWSPYRDITGENWDRVLADSIPRIALVKDADSYKRELMQLIGKAHDGHASLWNALAARPPVGECQLPIIVRFISNVPVVAGLASSADNGNPFRLGDVITDFDGTPVAKLIQQWMPYYTGSNDAARMRDVGRYLTRGDCTDVNVGVHRDQTDLTLKVKRVPSTIGDLDPGKHDLPGPAFRLLSKEVAYLKLSSVKADDAVHYLQQAEGTRGLIIDIRNYPSEFVVFALGSHLVDHPTLFATFTGGDLSNPGAFHWIDTESITPEKPHYPGKVVVLVDEVTLSQAEYTSMTFRAAGAIVVGSTTSGADGNVSPYSLPGGIHTMISGIGVFYPDKKPTQRVGIVPDVRVQPTVAGVRAGRDEVLEEGIRQILRTNTPEPEIEKMAKN